MQSEIESVTGAFGKYQSWILFLTMLARLPTDFQLTNVVFIVPNVEYICLDENAANATNYCPCQNPEYDRRTIVSSVTSEWDLICEKQSLASLAQSVLQFGILVGSVTYGFISDRFGRKISYLVAVFSNTIFIAMSGLAPEFWMFLICRFLIGSSTGGTMLCGYVLLIELSGKAFRSYFAGLNEISSIAAYFTLPIIAYFVRDWRNLQLVTSVPWLLVIVYYWLIPESPLWLVTMDRKDEAIAIYKNIATRNNRSIEKIETIVNRLDNESVQKKHKSGTYLDLFKTPKIRKYTIVTSLVWMFCSHTFFGINQFIGRLQGNIYLNVMLSAVSFTPTIIIVVIANRLFNRKIILVCSFCLAGISFLLFIIIIPHNLDVFTVVLAIIGQAGAYAAFVQVYLFTSELFPTTVRNSAMGYCSMFARIGGFIAPFVVNIGEDWITFTIFSSAAFGAALLNFLLPETKDKKLLNSIEQTEATQ